jgi:hypothetical protein
LPSFTLPAEFVGLFTFFGAKMTYFNRIVPLVSLQKKVYMSILRKELPKLLAISSGASNHQSLQNIVCQFMNFSPLAPLLFHSIYMLWYRKFPCSLTSSNPHWKNYFIYCRFLVDQTLHNSDIVILFFWCGRGLHEF